MVSMKWPTGIPLSARTFLKPCSAMSGFCCGTVWAAANPAPARATIAILDLIGVIINPIELIQDIRYRRLRPRGARTFACRVATPGDAWLPRTVLPGRCREELRHGT